MKHTKTAPNTNAAPNAAEASEPVYLEPQSIERRDEFLAATRRSRELHCDLVFPVDNATTYLAWLKRYESATHCSHFVISRTDQALVGVVNINDIVRGAFQCGSIGCFAFEPYARRGFMTAGLRLALDHAFGELELHRLEANIQPGNTPSVAMVRRLGFVLEGFSPQFLKVGGVWRDHERWAIRSDQWSESRSRSTP